MGRQIERHISEKSTIVKILLEILDLVHFLVKCCLYGLLNIIKLMLITGQVMLSKG